MIQLITFLFTFRTIFTDSLYCSPYTRHCAALPRLPPLREPLPDASGLKLLREAAEAMRLSARGYHRVLRVARTLADLDGADKVGRIHLAEALSYRVLVDEVRRAA